MTSILIADDSRTILDLVLISLRRDGFEPLEASNGEEALAAIRTHRPDLVILDAMMPPPDGYEICRTIRAEGGDYRPYVIILTASVRNTDREQAREAGADEFITKPFSPGELRARVKALAERSG
jgi:DNA-binding response OmpR family regulator